MQPSRCRQRRLQADRRHELTLHFQSAFVAYQFVNCNSACCDCACLFVYAMLAWRHTFNALQVHQRKANIKAAGFARHKDLRSMKEDLTYVCHHLWSCTILSRLSRFRLWLHCRASMDVCVQLLAFRPQEMQRMLACVPQRYSDEFAIEVITRVVHCLARGLCCRSSIWCEPRMH
jgi:hypothetical protein